MTSVERLYLADPYLAQCEARVVEVRGNTVMLSRTVFFPEGGGQLGDTGVIGESGVVDTQKVRGMPFARDNFPMIMVGGQIVHKLGEGAEPPKAGEDVQISIDWPRRYNIMKHHSAAHLAFWYATQARPDLYTQGCRISDTTARFDFYTKTPLDASAVKDWEGLSNEAVSQDLEIANAPVDGEPEALMWYCGDMRMPCGGTHVRSTAEIGAIHLRRKRQGGNLERLYITVDIGR
jgi:alanyl-tRNA synthetase